jgi:hypothetical protein
VVSDECKFLASEVSREVIHTPNGSLHFQQKGCVVAFVFLQLSAGICNDAMLAIRVDVSEDGAEATGLFVVTEAGVDDECIGPVASRVVDDRLGGEVRLEFKESLQGFRGKLVPLQGAVFFRQCC